MRKQTSGNSRCKTGVPGLDDVLTGGLPARRFYLIQGEPGTGKTTLALEFLREGVRCGERVLYIGLSETLEEIQEVVQSHGWSLKGVDVIDLAAIEQSLLTESQNTLFHPSEVELTETMKILLDALDRLKPARFVLDSLSELELLSHTALRYRREVLSLKQHLAKRNCTALFLDDTRIDASDAHVQSLANGTVFLEQTALEYGAERRRLIVRKIRGTKYRGGYHDFVIKRGGISVFPRLVAAEHHRKFAADNLRSGIKGMDTMLGGGLPRGTSNLFTGPPGSGKSTLALSYAIASAKKKQKVLLFTFDESLNVLFQRARGLKLGLDRFVKNGLIKAIKVDPAELSPGELAFNIKRSIEEEGIRFVYIDSLNGYLHAMGDERFLNLQLHELLTYLNQQGIVTILVLSPQGFIGPMKSPIDLTYLADTVVALRFFEADGAVHKAISVIKKRTGGHEKTIRELTIARAGITVGPPLEHFRGVLTGVPLLAETVGEEELKQSKHAGQP
jgi:circadian clock protein KaiC